MSTRCLTTVMDGAQPLVTMYRQCDGYPGGHGAELANLLKGKKIVNGISGEFSGRTYNGMGCLAASVVAEFKKGLGSFYLFPPGSRGVGEAYHYIISRENGKIYFRVESVDLGTGEIDEVLYSGYMDHAPTMRDLG